MFVLDEIEEDCLLIEAAHAHRTSGQIKLPAAVDRLVKDHGWWGINFIFDGKTLSYSWLSYLQIGCQQDIVLIIHEKLLNEVNWNIGDKLNWKTNSTTGDIAIWKV